MILRSYTGAPPSTPKHNLQSEKWRGHRPRKVAHVFQPTTQLCWWVAIIAALRNSLKEYNLAIYESEAARLTTLTGTWVFIATSRLQAWSCHHANQDAASIMLKSLPDVVSRAS